MYQDDFLQNRIDDRIESNAFRQLPVISNLNLIDFCSNDYLGIATCGRYNVLSENHGSKGARLLAGNSMLAEKTEQNIATYHKAEAALLFNSGFDANMGVLSSVAQKGDTIIYDQLCHASIRDGIRLSHATAYSFRHNDIKDLYKKCKQATGNLFIVTEAVFSMDGDLCPLEEIVNIAVSSGAHIILDEAHSIGVVGDEGQGLAQALNLEQKIFCRMYTYGKAGGCHGAAVTGSKRLIQFLMNFARSFIYTTALPPVNVAAINHFYKIFPAMAAERKILEQHIHLFQSSKISLPKLVSNSAIQGIVCPGNEQVKKLASELQKKGMDIRPVLHPTVAKGKERLRIVLHSFNTSEQIDLLIQSLRNLCIFLCLISF
jgi:8-amino-7-oxononanoate synthase